MKIINLNLNLSIFFIPLLLAFLFFAGCSSFKNHVKNDIRFQNIYYNYVCFGEKEFLDDMNKLNLFYDKNDSLYSSANSAILYKDNFYFYLEDYQGNFTNKISLPFKTELKNDTIYYHYYNLDQTKLLKSKACFSLIKSDTMVSIYKHHPTEEAWVNITFPYNYGLDDSTHYLGEESIYINGKNINCYKFKVFDQQPLPKGIRKNTGYIYIDKKQFFLVKEETSIYNLKGNLMGGTIDIIESMY